MTMYYLRSKENAQLIVYRDEDFPEHFGLIISNPDEQEQPFYDNPAYFFCGRRKFLEFSKSDWQTYLKDFSVYPLIEDADYQKL